MPRIFFPIFILAILGGCATTSTSLPTCDGYSRRPLNRAMRQWKAYSAEERQISQGESPNIDPTPSYVEEEPHGVRSLPFAGFEVSTSYQRCGG